MSKKVLCVDDDYKILSLLAKILNNEGYEVLCTENPLKAIEIAESEFPNIIILDVSMREKNGFEICRELRSHKEFNQTIIIFLTAQIDEESEIKGLEVGADDYLVKPFSAKVLSKKISSLSERYKRFYDQFQPATLIDSFKGIEINHKSHEIKVDGIDTKFYSREYKLLSFLIQNQDKVFSRKELLEAVWEDSLSYTDRTVDVHITKIRQKIGTYAGLLQTVSGYGYKLLSK